ncbi:hypothetical protein FOA52_004434 [Chlamydomonas sp. UWO 241]|nr:hypothetical protein FOA52_004434 [Chlamydomonas sp. UWO 241]
MDDGAAVATLVEDASSSGPGVTETPRRSGAGASPSGGGGITTAEQTTPVRSSGDCGTPQQPPPPLQQPRVERIDVQCNGMPGTLLITAQAILCRCKACSCSPANTRNGGRIMTPTEFERHAGCVASKKWRRSIKVVGAGGRAALAHGGLSVGRWLEQNGFVVDDEGKGGAQPRTPQQGPQGGKQAGGGTTPGAPSGKRGGAGPARSWVGKGAGASWPKQPAPAPAMDTERLLSMQSSMFHFGMPGGMGGQAGGHMGSPSSQFMHPSAAAAAFQLQLQRSYELRLMQLRLAQAADSPRSSGDPHASPALGQRSASVPVGGCVASARGSGREPRGEAGLGGRSRRGGGTGAGDISRGGAPEDELLAAANLLELLKSAPLDAAEEGDDGEARSDGSARHRRATTDDVPRQATARTGGTGGDGPAAAAAAATKRPRRVTADDADDCMSGDSSDVPAHRRNSHHKHQACQPPAGASPMYHGGAAMSMHHHAMAMDAGMYHPHGGTYGHGGLLPDPFRAQAAMLAQAHAHAQEAVAAEEAACGRGGGGGSGVGVGGSESDDGGSPRSARGRGGSGGTGEASSGRSGPPDGHSHGMMMHGGLPMMHSAPLMNDMMGMGMGMGMGGMGGMMGFNGMGGMMAALAAQQHIMQQQMPPGMGMGVMMGLPHGMSQQHAAALAMAGGMPYGMRHGGNGGGGGGGNGANGGGSRTPKRARPSMQQ